MHLRTVSIRQQRVGHPGAPGEYLPQPGAPREATLIHTVNYGQEEGWGLLAVVNLPQDWQACFGSTTLE